MFTKLQGHWIIEMSEMLATSKRKRALRRSALLSAGRKKPTGHPMNHSRKTGPAAVRVRRHIKSPLDFLPLDRAGNRRFLPVMVCPEDAEVHILEDEDGSRAYLLQVWAEAMEGTGRFPMEFSPAKSHTQKNISGGSKDFYAGGYESRNDCQVFGRPYQISPCSKQLYKEAPAS